ncbi:B-cell differentiation antigen CD72 [Eulemur rufifrons]|uniref:B-cell differentiation antigen CD72 n=1 Tax=Eulemur rufifrons TaxID=859984 RepID=UPI0037445E4D
MAEAITYADLRFVKAPLKKSVSIRMGQGQDPEADEDGELTYENVQVTPAPGGPSSLVSSGLDAGVKAEQAAAAWRSVTSPAARLALSCRAPCWHYLLLCLLLTCLLLGVAATCLGVRYLQASQQLQQMNRVLEATNSSLRQQLRLKITQLGQREEDLQGSRRELAQSQEALQAEQRVHRDAEEQLQACQSDRVKTNESLQGEKERRSALEQQLSSIGDTLKPLLPCQSQDTCCPVGWIQYSKSCFYFSSTRKSWQMSKNLCESLSSKLATFSESYQNSLARQLPELLNGFFDFVACGLSGREVPYLVGCIVGSGSLGPEQNTE